MVWDAFIVILAASGFLMLLWCFLGYMLRPVFGERMTTLYPVQGDGEELEQAVRAFAWLREGRLSGGKFLIVDLGLSEQGKKLAVALEHRYGWVTYIPKTDEEQPEWCKVFAFSAKR